MKAILLALICTAAQADTVGMHLGTVHDRPGFNGSNPGLYVIMDDYIAGAYQNSENAPSAYAGKVFNYAAWDFAAVVMTGYKVGTVTTVLPSHTFKLSDTLSGRVTFIINPIGANGLHLSVEQAF